MSGGVPLSVLPTVRRAVAGLTPAHLVAIALVGAGTVIALAPPNDPDVWWHLRTGDLVLDQHRLARTDPWSLTARGRPWVQHEWLAQVVLALFHRAFGLHGISLYRSVGVTVLLTLLALQCFRRTTPYRALGCLTLAFFATTGGWGERPQLFSWILLVPAAELVRRAVDGRSSPWWLVPLTYLWANLHGLWILSPALLVIGILGVLCRDGWNAGRDRAARLTSVATLCVLTAGLTPIGPRLLLEPFKVQAYGQFVNEWAAPSLHSAYGLAFFAMLAALLTRYALSTDPVDRYTLLQVLFGATFGLLYIRTLAPGAVLLTPLLADACGRPRAEPGDALRPRLAAAALTAVGCLIAIGCTFALTGLRDLPRNAPVAATRALLGVPAPQRVIDEYDIGGWLLDQAPPSRPAIDGRTEIYPLPYVRNYLEALRMEGDWKSTIDQLHANVALLRPGTALVNGLRDQLHWRTVYADRYWLVLVPPTTGAP